MPWLARPGAVVWYGGVLREVPWCQARSTIRVPVNVWTMTQQ